MKSTPARMAAMAMAALANGSVGAQSAEPVVQGGHQGSVLATAFARDERLMATAGSERTVQVRDVVERLVLFSRPMAGEPRDLTFSTDGSILAACGHTDDGHGFVQAWDARSGTPGVTRSFEGLRGQPYALAWYPGDRQLAVAGFDGAVMILDPATFETRTVLRGSAMSSDLRLAISRDGTQVAVAARNGMLNQWDAGAGALLHELKLRSSLSAIAFRADGSLLAGFTPHEKDPGVLSIDNGTAGEMRNLPHPGGAHALAFSSGGTTVVTGGKDVRKWETATGRPLWTAPTRRSRILAMSISPGGTLVGSAGDERDRFHSRRGAVMNGRGRVELWDGATGAVRNSGPMGPPAVLALAFSPDGRTLACGTDGPDPMIVLWDLERARPARAFPGTGPVRQLAFHPSGQRIVTAGWHDGLHTFDLDAGGAVRDLGSPQGGIHFALSTGGRLLATARDFSNDQDPGTLDLWDLDRGARLHTLVRDDRVTGAVFLPDGSGLAADVQGYRDGRDFCEIRIFDPVTGEALRTLEVPTGPGHGRRRGISDLSISPDGRFLAAGRFHDRLTRAQVPGGAALWELASGELKWSSRHEPPFAWLDGGRTLVAGGMVPIDAATGAARPSLISGDPSREALRFEAFSDLLISPDGAVVAGVQPGDRFGPAAWSLLHFSGTRPSVPAITLRIPAATHAAALPPNGGAFATAGGDGLVRIWDPRTGALRASLAVFPTGSASEPAFEWAAFTPTGFHAASPDLGSRIHWRSGDRILSAAEAERDLHRPELVAHAITG